MSANPNNAQGSTIVTIQSPSAPSQQQQQYASPSSTTTVAQSTNSSNSSSSAEPITITRRINVKIQGSMSDFAQDGQGCATWRPVDGKQAAIWGLQVNFCLAWRSHTLAFTYGLEGVAAPCRTHITLDFLPRTLLPTVETLPMVMLQAPMLPPPMPLAMLSSSLPSSSSTNLPSRFPLGSPFPAFLPMR